MKYKKNNHIKHNTNLEMGHTVLIAAGIVITLNEEEVDVDTQYETLFGKLKKITRNRCSSYFSKYSPETYEYYLY